MEQSTSSAILRKLIVYGVIGVFLIGVSVAVSWYLSVKNKDEKTLADIAQIRSALEIVYAVNTYYPQEDQLVVLGAREYATEKLCLRGFEDFSAECEKEILPRLPKSNADDVVYYQSLENGREYQIQFSLRSSQRQLGLLEGVQCATREGVRSGECN
jgi:hypothetical protein